MVAPTHHDALVFMQYYALWDTPLDGEAWALFRTLRADGAFDSFDRFSERVPPGSHDFVLFDRVLCAFEQAGELMKHELMHPDLYFDAWASPSATWSTVADVVHGLRKQHSNDHIYSNLEWLAGRGEAWYAAHDPASA